MGSATMMRSTPRNGFTLVELSVVLVILGLLVGGVLAGQSLIKASEIKSLITSMNRLQTAVVAFRDKYNGLPGDMTNATTYWGALYPDVATCLAQIDSIGSTDTTTCNGDGNGRIDNLYEHYHAFKQLSAAGFIEGKYTGARNNGYAIGTFAGSNIMGTARTNVGIDVQTLSSSAQPTIVDLNEDLYLILGGSRWNYDEPASAGISSQDAWHMDTKMDDGLPMAGKLRERFKVSFNTQCISAGLYDLSSVDSTSYTVTFNANIYPGCQLTYAIGGQQ